MIINVEMAFQLGDLEEEIYMVCNDVHGEDDIFFLRQSIYGLVQVI